jgi:hypothetical protein
MGLCQSIGITTSVIMSLEKSGVRHNSSTSLNFLNLNCTVRSGVYELCWTVSQGGKLRWGQ